MRIIEMRDPAAAAPGPELEVEATARCTKAGNGNQASCLYDVGGTLRHDSEPDATAWRGEVCTLADCARGELVFAELGIDTSRIKSWPLVAIIA